MRDGRVPDEVLRVESQWAEAATPTFAAGRRPVKLYSADMLLPRRFARRALGYSDTDIRDVEAEAYSRVIGVDQVAEFGPKPAPSPGRHADDEPEIPQPRAPVNGLGASVLPPPAVQFLEPTTGQ